MLGRARLPLVLLLIVLVSLPANFELFKPGYFANHDGEGHIIRLTEFHLALADGHFPPRLSKNLMFGYGYYFFNFNYPALYWVGEVLHLAGLGFVDSIKAITILSTVLSGIFMFLWQRMHWGTWGGIAAAALYMYAPYRFLNVYVRGAIAEHLAFILLPLLFMFTEKIAEGEAKKRKLYILGAALSFTVLLLSHNIMAFIFGLMLALFMLFHLGLYRKVKNILHFALFGILGLGASAYFWIPAIFEKKYVRLDQTIGQDFPNHFVFLHQLFIPSWGFGSSVPGAGDGLSFQIGLVHLAAVALSIPAVFFLWKSKRQKAFHVLFYLFLLFLSFFLMLETSKPFWNLVPLLAFTQFPWRFLSWTVFTTSILGGAVVFVTASILKDRTFVAPTLCSIVIAGLFWANHTYWVPNIRTKASFSYDQPIAGSTTWADEQFPIWFDPKPNAFPTARVVISEGQGKIENVIWKTANHSYKITADSQIKVVENTAYYPGWNLKVNGKKHNFSFKDNKYPGRIVYTLPRGTHVVETNFSETPLRLAADFVSLATVVAGIILFVLN